MKAIAYMRRSQDSGTGVSEEIQDEAIRAYVERKGGTVVYWLPPDLDASSWTLERPSMQKALRLLAEGKADTLVVAKLSRVTRRRRDWEWLLETMREQGWTIKSADFDVDLSDKSGRLIAGILIDFLGFEHEEKRDGLNDARRNAVLVHGVHGGDRAPLGYEFTIRGYDKRGNPLRGPLAPNADAARIQAAHEAFNADDPRVRAWSNIIRILGVKSQGNAASILSNGVYLGEARSGAYVKAGAHPALVEETLFRRTQRRLAEGRRSVAYGGRVGALLGAGILRCGTCGRALVRDASKQGEHYRCKNLTCTARASIQAKAIEPVVLFRAFAAHAALNPLQVADLDAARLVAVEQELAKAQAELAEVEAAHERGELSPVAYGKALTAAERAVAAARAALADTEASRGWLGIGTEAVQRRLLTDDGTALATDPGFVKDIAAARDFVKTMVRVTVFPVGRGRKLPVEERIEVEVLTPLAAAAYVRTEEPDELVQVRLLQHPQADEAA
jgi:DNA invertase Pin-like site-specific DNA recombinase